jgi:hypothetical protein
VITNATLTNITAPAAADARGNPTYGAGTTLDARCLIDDPTRAQLIANAGKLADIAAVLYVLKSNTPAGVTFAPRYRVTGAVDGSAAITYEVLKVVDREKAGGLSHFECYLKVMQ